MAQRKYQKLLHSVLLLQTQTRGCQARQRCMEMREALNLLADYTQTQERFQAWARKLIAVNRYRQLQQAAVTLQCRYRAQRLARSVRLQYQLTLGAAVVFQSAWKMHVRRYRAKCLGEVFRTAFLLIREATVMIQKHARGYIARQRYQEQRLCSGATYRRGATRKLKRTERRQQRAEFLRQFAAVARKQLAVVKYSNAVCCERLVEVNAVGVIFRLIQSCNRSLPHMELIKYSISILLNLAKYEKTTPAVYEVDNSVSTLVELMTIYREKGGAIFTKTCMLLAILGFDAERREVSIEVISSVTGNVC
nr:hypothetical protein BaRGS_020798 [Batillaria attramentaria]